MAKKPAFELPYEETEALYKAAIIAASLNHVNITILSDNKAKEIFKVNKANKLLKFRTDDDVIIILNEKIFDQLTPEQRLIVVEESLAGIVYDSATDTFEIKKADVNTYKGVLKKHTYAVWEVLNESIKTLYQVEKDEEQIKKDQTEKAKKQKSF